MYVCVCVTATVHRADEFCVYWICAHIWACRSDGISSSTLFQLFTASWSFAPIAPFQTQSMLMFLILFFFCYCCSNPILVDRIKYISIAAGIVAVYMYYSVLQEQLTKTKYDVDANAKDNKTKGDTFEFEVTLLGLQFLVFWIVARGNFRYQISVDIFFEHLKRTFISISQRCCGCSHKSRTKRHTLCISWQPFSSCSPHGALLWPCAMLRIQFKWLVSQPNP